MDSASQDRLVGHRDRLVGVELVEGGAQLVQSLHAIAVGQGVVDPRPLRGQGVHRELNRQLVVTT